MSSLVVLSLIIGQFDMSGAEYHFDMSGSAETVVSRVEPFPLIAPPKKVTVFAYYASFKCPPCNDAKSEISQGKLLVDVVPKDAPEWVTSFPTFHWQQKDGSWMQHKGWPGLDRFQKMVLRTWNSEVERETRPTYKQQSSKFVGVSPNTRENVLRHLLQDGIHRGRFTDVESTLKTMSHDELLALHSDHHNGTVDWSWFGEKNIRHYVEPRRNKSFLFWKW